MRHQGVQDRRLATPHRSPSDPRREPGGGLGFSGATRCACSAIATRSSSRGRVPNGPAARIQGLPHVRNQRFRPVLPPRHRGRPRRHANSRRRHRARWHPDRPQRAPDADRRGSGGDRPPVRRRRPAVPATRPAGDRGEHRRDRHLVAGPVDPYAGVVLEPPNLGAAVPGRSDRRGAVARPGPAGIPGPRHERRRARRAGVRGGARRRRLHLPDRLDGRRRRDRHRRRDPPRARRPGRRARPRARGARRPALRLRRHRPRRGDRGRRRAGPRGARDPGGRRLGVPRRRAPRRCEPGQELSAKDVAEGALAGDPACRRRHGSGAPRARRRVRRLRQRLQPAPDRHRRLDRRGRGRPPASSPIRDAIASEAFDVVARRVTIVPAELGGDVSLAGAQPLVMSRLNQTSQTSPAARSARPVAVPGGTHV